MKKKTIYPVISQRTTRTKWAKIKRGEYFPVYSLFNLLNKSVCSLSIYWSLYTYVPHIHFISVATISNQCRILAKTDRSFHSECIIFTHRKNVWDFNLYLFVCEIKMIDWLIDLKLAFLKSFISGYQWFWTQTCFEFLNILANISLLEITKNPLLQTENIFFFFKMH